MRTEKGFHRLVAFSDAVVAIAITLLILPLVDRASSIGSTGVPTFIHENQYRLLAFTLSFAVIGNFWWAQHQSLERVRAYNPALVGAIFVWLFSIVFLPFPTELIGSPRPGNVATHAIYVGTMLVTTIAALVQEWAIVRWPDLQAEAHRGSATIDSALTLTILMAFAFVITITVPYVGLWCLLVLLLARPGQRVVTGVHRRMAGEPAPPR